MPVLRAQSTIRASAAKPASVKPVQAVAAAVASAVVLLAPAASFAKLPDGVSSPKLAKDASGGYASIVADRNGKGVPSLPKDKQLTGVFLPPTAYKADRIPLVGNAQTAQ